MSFPKSVGVLRSFAKKWIRPTRQDSWWAGFSIFSLLAAGTGLVYFSGGTHLSTLHFMYLPIILAGFAFSIQGGMVTGALAGLLLGPWMPENVDLQLYQPLFSWVSRFGFLVLAGFFAGLGCAVLRAYFKLQERLYLTDPVTKLPNHTALRRDFHQLQKQGTPPSALWIITLPNLVEISQTISPAQTTSFLHAVGNRLKKCAPEAKIAHIPPRSYALLVPHEEDPKKALHQCRQALTKPFQIGNIPFLAEPNYGLVTYPEQGIGFSDFLRHGHIAAAQCNSTGRDFESFSKKDEKKASHNVNIMHALHQALEKEELSLVYQPKVELSTGHTVGLEALTRWHSATLGDISPEEFIPLTERTLLIHPFSKWVVKQALKDAEKWKNATRPPKLALNFSVKNLMNQDLADYLFQQLEISSLTAKNVEIEMTESAIAEDIDRIADTLARIREKGISVAIDDFGTGASSMQYLLDLPIDILKIDKHFVQAMENNAHANAIVKSAIELGRALKVDVIAEGIETQDQFELLKSMGCPYGQGFWIARPMKAEEVSSWLKTPFAVHKGIRASNQA
ncbi:MAG: EAL domain-containing protein [bacterium]|nr:EAL domain-containing protein [bacterium]